jgi:hypothetical protein
MSIFKKLENIFGKSSESYENLMSSRDQDHDFSERDVGNVADLLKPIVVSAESVKLPDQFAKLPDGLRIKDHDLNKYAYVSSITFKDVQYHLLTIKDKSLSDERFTLLIPFNELELDENLINRQLPTISTIKSLPDWESARFVAPEIYQQCADLSRNPWTLYKLAALSLVGKQNHKAQISGYPRWIKNFPRKELGNSLPSLIFEWHLSTYYHVGAVYFLERDNGSLTTVMQRD